MFSPKIKVFYCQLADGPYMAVCNHPEITFCFEAKTEVLLMEKIQELFIQAFWNKLIPEVEFIEQKLARVNL